MSTGGVLKRRLEQPAFTAAPLPNEAMAPPQKRASAAALSNAIATATAAIPSAVPIAQPAVAQTVTATQRPPSSATTTAPTTQTSSKPTSTGTGAVSSKLPSKVEIIVDDIVVDTSVKRVNSQGITVYKQYRRGRFLGKGGFAHCYELQSLDSHKIYAGKVIPKASIQKPSARKKLLAEISIHRKIHHTHVVKFERFFEDQRNVYILLEICANHTLMEMVKRRKRLTETETQFYMWQLTNTIMHLHENNIIHRDLKLGNLFLNENLDLRIGDFGLATQLEHPDERKRTLCGTPNYLAPEILDSTNGHSFEVDTWAMGVIMYTLLIGQPPFETDSVKTTYKRIRDNAYDFPQHVTISPAARSLIVRILAASPSDRPTLAEMKADPFFTQSPFPKQLPTSCLTQPLEWRHEYHHAHGLIGQENAGVNGGAEAPNSARPTLTSRALNTQPLAAPDAKQPQSQQQPLTKPISATFGLTAFPLTALQGPRSSAPVRTSAGNENKITSPLGQAPAAPTKRLSSATPIAIAPLHTAASTEMPAPSPTYAATGANPLVNGFFKDIAQQPQQQPYQPQIAVPKRVSGGGERRVSSRGRTSGGEEAQQYTPPKQSTPPKRLSSGGAVAPVALPSVDDELAHGMQELKVIVTPPQAVPTSEAAAAPEEADVSPEDREDVRKMHDEIERSFCQAPGASKLIASEAVALVAPAPLVPAELWVNKWVDYSNKYGLGYLLSNGDSGVYFNDSSKAILSADGENFEYLERRPSSTSTVTSSEPERMCYTLTNYPSALQKKVTLLKHFMNYLVPTPEDAVAVKAAAAATASSSTSPTAPRVYVKKWLRTKHAIFFRLSNRTVQVIFLDHTELVLSSAHNTVTYTDKTKRRETFSLDRSSDGTDPTQTRPDLAKRMKYTKDILHHLLTHTTTPAARPATAEEKQ